MQTPASPEKPLKEERSLQAQADAFRFQESVLNASGLAIMSTSSEGVVTRFNHAAEKLLGYRANEVIGKQWLMFHDGDELLKQSQDITTITGKNTGLSFETVVARALHQKAPDRCDWSLLRKDGSRVPVNLTIFSLENEDPAAGFGGIISDLTIQHRLKEEIEGSEQKFTLLAENITGAIYLCLNDASYSVIYLNDHIEKITGYGKRDFYSGKVTFAALFHPEDREMIVQTINQALAARTSFHLQYRMLHASGDWRWVDETGVGVFEGNELMMLEGFLYDITHQKHAEEKLKKVAEENLRFFNNPVNLNAVVDFNGYLQRISPSWTKMLGWTDEELKSRPVMDFIHREDVESTRESLRYIAKAKKVHIFENRFVCKDGTHRWLLWGSASDPETKMIYASAVDISARKKSEETILDSKSNLEGLTLQLREQNRKLDEFAHIISHNLRAPVNNIQALINLLDNNSDISDYKLIFDKLKNVSKNLSETMNELMDTLKVKTQPQVDLTQLRFKEVLDKVVQSLEGELIVAEASVTFDFNDAPSIHYSKPYLESIFQNLLTNAIKYRSTERKPNIHFKTFIRENHLELEVTDNGQGIDMEQFGDKIFGMHKTFHDHKEARGVGLFLIKTQIEALGGSISVTSKVDQGTTFKIRFN